MDVIKTSLLAQPFRDLLAVVLLIFIVVFTGTAYLLTCKYVGASGDVDYCYVVVSDIVKNGSYETVYSVYGKVDWRRDVEIARLPTYEAAHETSIRQCPAVQR